MAESNMDINFMDERDLFKLFNISGEDANMTLDNETLYELWLAQHLPKPMNLDPFIQWTLYIAYTAILVFGILGNALVICVVSKTPSMRNVTNYFIANLAISDIFMCVLAVPFTSAHMIMGTWLFGEMLCHIVPFVQGVSVYVSTFTLVAIAVDRYIVIVHPFSKRMQNRCCLTTIACIWLGAFLFTAPYGFFIRHFEIPLGAYCQENWPSEKFRQCFSIMTSVLQFGIPFIGVSFCYTRVCCKLRQRVRKKSARSGRVLEHQRTRRTNRMLIIMVFVFALSWMPLNVHNLWLDFDIPAASYSASMDNVYFFACHAAAMSSTCYNPFLYAWLNENFRKEFKTVLPWFRPAALTQSICRSDSQTIINRTQNGTTIQPDNTIQDSYLPKSSNIEHSSTTLPTLISVRYSATEDQIFLTVPASASSQRTTADLV